MMALMGDLDIRLAAPKDRLAVMRLWCEDFEHHEPYFSWYFSHVYRPERTLCGFIDDDLVGVVQLAPYRLRLRDAELPCCYLVGVITHPDYRGFGYGRLMVQAAMDYLRGQGYAMVLLATHIPNFYRKLGFSVCHAQQRLLIPAADTVQSAGRLLPPLVIAPPVSIPAGKWRKGRICVADIAACESIQRRQTADCGGYLLRSEADWRQMLQEDACEGSTLWLSDDAYVVLTPYFGELIARELCYADAAALQDALDLCAAEAQRQKQKFCLWRAPLEAPLPQTYLIDDDGNTLMAAACDLPQLLTAISYPPQLRAEVTLLVDGERLPLQIADGRAVIGGNGAEYALTTQQLSRLIWSAEQGSEEATLPDAVTQLFPGITTWINNYT
ncbi:MAG: GNAT family N-acetyltransferase [Firmicutes bacterium]|nr:GNAT family N-acetyltransferase [Bacillota bacterium]